MKGRGSSLKPRNRFLGVEYVEDFEHFEGDEEFLAELGRSRTVYQADTSRTIVSENDSPDLAFRYSLNPYRGCAHGCAYGWLYCRIYPDELESHLWLSRFGIFASSKSKQDCQSGISE